jgi:hypothetical protein
MERMGGDVLYARMVDTMARAQAGTVGRYINARSLDHASRFSGFAMAPNVLLPPGEREVDFLGVGCSKQAPVETHRTTSGIASLIEKGPPTLDAGQGRFGSTFYLDEAQGAVRQKCATPVLTQSGKLALIWCVCSQFPMAREP